MPFLKEGEQWPRTEDLPRLAKYERFKKIFDGVPHDIFKRARDILADTPQAPQLERLYIAINLMDVLVTKPADMLVGKGVTFESGKPDDSTEQVTLNSIVEENEMNKQIYEGAVQGGINGNAWFKTYFGARHDLSIYSELELSLPTQMSGFTPNIESVPSSQVFPEMVGGSNKKFRVINIATIEHVTEKNWYGKDVERHYLDVERHIPGYVLYERYQLAHTGVENIDGVGIGMYSVVKQVETGRGISDIESTGCREFLVRHAPYKASPDSWEGIGVIEKLEETLMAINDRLMQIDYILWKHTDPTAYGPELPTDGNSARFGGKYIPVEKDTDVPPGYMTWNSQLSEAFKQLDYLLSVVFQQAETPQWLFGTTITQDKGGTGTSHSDGRAIEMRLLPIMSKVRRIKMYMEPAIRDVLWLAQELENNGSRGVGTFRPYTPVYPTIHWDNPIPEDAKEQAEIMSLRTGGRPTLDVRSAIKRSDKLDDSAAQEIIDRIKADEEADALAEPSVFNGTPFGEATINEDDTGTEL